MITLQYTSLYLWKIMFVFPLDSLDWPGLFCLGQIHHLRSHLPSRIDASTDGSKIWFKDCSSTPFNRWDLDASIQWCSNKFSHDPLNDRNGEENGGSLCGVVVENWCHCSGLNLGSRPFVQHNLAVWRSPGGPGTFQRCGDAWGLNRSCLQLMAAMYPSYHLLTLATTNQLGLHCIQHRLN